MEKNKLKCNSCNEVKDIDEFYHNERRYNKSRQFRSGYCKDCSRKRYIKYNEKRRGKKIDVEKEAMTILTKLGYDIESEKPIYIQFKERWGV
jgi:hypothetical protein